MQIEQSSFAKSHESPHQISDMFFLLRAIKLFCPSCESSFVIEISEVYWRLMAALTDLKPVVVVAASFRFTFKFNDAIL